MLTKPKNAILALEDGTIFRGRSVGAPGMTVGETVFNTSMSGYQEILTDPSYARQLVTLTYPHIGNTGCNDDDMEAATPHAAGLIVRDLPATSSNYRATSSLEDFLRSHQIVAIADIDTRKLTRHLRTHGALAGCIMAGEDLSEADAVNHAKGFPGLSGMDLAKIVSAAASYEWAEGEFDLDQQQYAKPTTDCHVVAYDFGIKRQILRLLVEQGCRVTVVPATTPASEALALNPDGIFLSNGPGDPEPCAYAIEAISDLVERGLPVFGICLGHQLLALACGAKSEKMKFGHHGANHPVSHLASGEVLITSQNHGFAVSEASLPDNVEATHRSLFDGSLQGIRLRDKPAFGFQGHPEASPGPRDIRGLFAQFRAMIDQHKG